MCQGIDLTIKIRSGSAGQREVLLSDGSTISEHDAVNWVVRDLNGSVLDFGCELFELIAQYGHVSGTADAQRTT